MPDWEIKAPFLPICQDYCQKCNENGRQRDGETESLRLYQKDFPRAARRQKILVGHFARGFAIRRIGQGVRVLRRDRKPDHGTHHSQKPARQRPVRDVRQNPRHPQHRLRLQTLQQRETRHGALYVFQQNERNGLRSRPDPAFAGKEISETDVVLP